VAGGPPQGTPPPVAAEVGTWTEALQGRGQRAGPARQDHTIQGYLRILEAPLATWADRHDSLRQVTTEDLAAELAPLTGATRLLALSAMRSLFGTLKARRVVFANPAAPDQRPCCHPLLRRTRPDRTARRRRAWPPAPWPWRQAGSMKR
jgi:hypothetical protein